MVLPLCLFAWSLAGCGTHGESFDASEAFTGSGIQAATEGELCLVSEHVVEHACQHANFGPFASVGAASYPGPVFASISSPHTAYAVALPASGAEFLGQVLYQPPATGAFAFLLNPDLGVEIYDSSGALVPPVGEQLVAPQVCGQLSTAVVYQLDETETYNVVAGPAPTASYLAIVEYLGTAPSCDECEHVDLTASLSRHPRSREDASVVLEHEVLFEIPEEIPVTEGIAAGSRATLKFSHAGDWSRCRYLGSPSRSDALLLASCSHGYSAGDDAEADAFELRVDSTGPCGVLRLGLEIHPEACEDHEDE